MPLDVTLPSLGEDAADEATIGYWLVVEGDKVREGDDLVEMTTDKAAFSVPSPADGTVARIVASEGDVVRVGDVLCTFE
jgi:pyruvate/2-oxoglutarate dehydrogenase complex dihydrolipoamide acyltransferase (E2) component